MMVRSQVHLLFNSNMINVMSHSDFNQNSSFTAAIGLPLIIECPGHVKILRDQTAHDKKGTTAYNTICNAVPFVRAVVRIKSDWMGYRTITY